MEQSAVQKVKKTLSAKYPTIPELYSNDAIVAATSLEELEEACKAKIQQVQQERGLRLDWNKSMKDYRAKKKAMEGTPTTREGRLELSKIKELAISKQTLPFVWKRDEWAKLSESISNEVINKMLIGICNNVFDSFVLSELIRQDMHVEKNNELGMRGVENKYLLMADSCKKLADDVKNYFSGVKEVFKISEDRIRNSYNRLTQRGLIAHEVRLCLTNYLGYRIRKTIIFINYPYLLKVLLKEDGMIIEEVSNKEIKAIPKKKLTIKKREITTLFTIEEVKIWYSKHKYHLAGLLYNFIGDKTCAKIEMHRVANLMEKELAVDIPLAKVNPLLLMLISDGLIQRRQIKSGEAYTYYKPAEKVKTEDDVEEAKNANENVIEKVEEKTEVKPMSETKIELNSTVDDASDLPLLFNVLIKKGILTEEGDLTEKAMDSGKFKYEQQKLEEELPGKKTIVRTIVVTIAGFRDVVKFYTKEVAEAARK